MHFSIVGDEGVGEIGLLVTRAVILVILGIERLRFLPRLRIKLHLPITVREGALRQTNLGTEDVLRMKRRKCCEFLLNEKVLSVAEAGYGPIIEKCDLGQPCAPHRFLPVRSCTTR